MDRSDPPSEPPANAGDPAELRGVVLYVEDDHTNYALVEGLLSRHPGVYLLRATTGHDGIRMARSEQPDVILLDMHLPDIFGVEVVRVLSEDVANGRFRIILLTADSLNIDVLKAMSLGAFEYLVKPVEGRTLEASVRRALRSRSRPAS